MSTKAKNQKPLIIAAIAFVVLVVAGVVIWQVTAPKGTAGAKAYTLTVVDADGKETVHNLNTDEEMLGTALQDADLSKAKRANTACSSQKWTALKPTARIKSGGV